MDRPTDGEPSTGYQILRREDSADPSLSVLVDDTENTDTGYTDANVAAGKTYIYRVKARIAGGLSEESLPAKVKIENYHVSGTSCTFDDCWLKPIYNPRFLDTDEVGTTVRADEYVIGVSINGDSRAYSVENLWWKEVVKDTVGGTPIAVTWCSNCLTTIVYDRTVDGEVYNFGVSGRLMGRGASGSPGCLVMFDHQTKSLWSQVLGAGVGGEHAGTELQPVPHTLTTWGEWVKLHPDSKILDEPQSGSNIDIFVKEPDDSNWLERPRIAASAAKIGDQRIGYPLNRLVEPGVQNTEFNGVSTLLFYDSGSKTALIFDRTVDGEDPLIPVRQRFRRRHGAGGPADRQQVAGVHRRRHRRRTGGQAAGTDPLPFDLLEDLAESLPRSAQLHAKPVIPAQPTNLAVFAAAGEALDLSASWDATEGATLYDLRWRQADGEFEADNATSPSLTLAPPSRCPATANGKCGCKPATTSAAARRQCRNSRSETPNGTAQGLPRAVGGGAGGIKPAEAQPEAANRDGPSAQSSHTTSIVYVIDDSGSMDGDFPEVRTALKAVRGEAMPNTKVALIAFGTDPDNDFRAYRPLVGRDDRALDGRAHQRLWREAGRHLLQTAVRECQGAAGRRHRRHRHYQEDYLSHRRPGAPAGCRGPGDH